MRRFFKKLLTILFTGFLILNSPNAFAASDDPACHVEEVTPGVQAEVRTITSQPGIQSVKIETSVFPMGGVGRDEGLGVPPNSNPHRTVVDSIRPERSRSRRRRVSAAEWRGPLS